MNRLARRMLAEFRAVEIQARKGFIHGLAREVPLMPPILQGNRLLGLEPTDWLVLGLGIALAAMLAAVVVA